MTTIQTAFRKAIADSFDLSELALLCADIGIDPDSVPGRDKGKDFYLSQILDFAQRRKLSDTLVRQVKAVRPHLQLDLFSLDIASISGWLYGDAHLEIDRKVFQEACKSLGQHVELMRSLKHDVKKFNSNHHYANDTLSAMSRFIGDSEKPEFEFLDPHLEEVRLSLLTAINDFCGYLLVAGAGIVRDAGPAHHAEVIEAITNAYYAFVREGRRWLAPPPPYSDC